jgi:hypothetical protein
VTGASEVEVAHEALIRHWAKLRTWIDEDRVLLNVRDGITKAAKERREKPEDKTLLIHRGRRLAIIEEVIEKATISLNDSEKEYISACQSADNLQRIWFWTSRAFVSAIAVSVVFGAYL